MVVYKDWIVLPGVSFRGELCFQSLVTKRKDLAEFLL